MITEGYQAQCSRDHSCESAFSRYRMEKEKKIRERTRAASQKSL